MCSACAGDYENPGMTAPASDSDLAENPNTIPRSSGAIGKCQRGTQGPKRKQAGQAPRLQEQLQREARNQVQRLAVRKAEALGRTTTQTERGKVRSGNAMGARGDGTQRMTKTMRRYEPAHEAGSRPATQRGRDYRLRTQLEMIRDVMLSAAQGDSWLTLREIAAITHYGEASISAQLRHLRKPAFGSYVVEKRRREGDPAKGGTGAVWEYKLEARDCRQGGTGDAGGSEAKRQRATESNPSSLQRLVSGFQARSFTGWGGVNQSRASGAEARWVGSLSCRS